MVGNEKKPAEKKQDIVACAAPAILCACFCTEAGEESVTYKEEASRHSSFIRLRCIL